MKAKFVIAMILMFGAVCFATVTSTETKRQYFDCNGSTTTYTFTLPCNSSDDIKVEKVLLSTGDPTTLIEDTDYTITNTGSSYLEGGVVTIDPALAATYSLVITREIVLTQETVAGAITPATVVLALDKVTRLAQDARNDIDQRVIRIPDSDPSAAYDELANSVERAGYWLGFDSTTGAPYAGTPAATGISVSAFMATLNDDADATTALTTLGFSAYGQTLIDDATSGAALTTLGLSAYIQTLIDDATAAAARTTLEITTSNVMGIINVTDPPYNATGDGSTDDATAIQAAFDALSNGDTIYFPNTGSNYVVKSALTCDTDNIRIIGGTKELGSRIDFQSMSSADGLTLGGYGLYIENFYVLSSDHSTDDGLVLWRDTAGASHDHTLIHCNFSGHGGDGLLVARAQTTTLIGCKAVSNGGDGLSFDGSLNGGGGGTSVTCIGCWSDSNTRYGCHVKSITGFNWSGGANVANENRAFHFTYASGCSITGVDCEGATGTGGCILTDGNSHGIKFDGIHVSGIASGEVGFAINASEAVTVDNIVFESITGDHFGLTNVVDCHIGKVTDTDDGDASAITFANRTGSCTRSPGQLLSFGNGDTTPSVCAGPNFDIPNAVTITRLDDGTPCQEVTLISKAAVVFDTTANARLIGSSVDITTASGDVTKWVCEVGGTTSSVWRLLSFTDISADWSGGL